MAKTRNDYFQEQLDKGVDPKTAYQKALTKSRNDSTFQMSDLLPLVGGVVGGTLGAIGGPVGIAAGGAAGSALGEAGRQKLQKEDTDLKRIAIEGAWGTLGGVGGKGASTAVRAGESAARRVAETQGEKLALKALRPTSSQMRVFKEATKKELGDYVVQKNLFQKGVGAVDNLIDDAYKSFDALAIKSGKKVSNNQVIDAFNSRINELMNDTSPAMQAKGRELSKVAENFIGRYGDEVHDISTLTKERRKYDSLIRKFKLDPANSGVNEEARFVLEKVIQDATKGMKAGGKSLDELGTELKELHQFRKIAAQQEGLGAGSLPIGLSQIGALAGGGVIGGFSGHSSGGDATSTIVGALTGMGLGSLANNPKVVAYLAKTLIGKGERKVVESATKKIVKEGIGQIAGQSAVQAIKGVGQNNMSPASDFISPQTAMDNMTPNPSLPNDAEPILSEDGQWQWDDNAPTRLDPTQPGDWVPVKNAAAGGMTGLPSQESLQQAYMTAFLSGNTKQADFIKEAMGVLYPEQKGPGKLSDTAIGRVSDTQSAIQQLTNLGQMLANNTGGTGPLLLGSGELKAKIPGSQSQKLQSEIDRVRQIVGKALEGGVLRKEDEDKYKKILPTISDTPEIAQYKINSILNQLNAQLSTYTELQNTRGGGTFPTTPQEVQF